MTGDTTLVTKIVHVKVEEGKTGLFYATSPDLKGLLVAEPTIDKLEEAIPQAIRDLYSVCGVDVVVSKATGESERDSLTPWVAMPAAIAKKALERHLADA